MMRLQDRCELRCLKLAKLCNIEDVALSSVVSEDNELVQVEDTTVLKLRREARQILKLTRWFSFYFMVLSCMYLFSAIVCYNHLSQAEFDRYFSNKAYAAEMYGMVSTIGLVNIIHALTLISLAAFMIVFTRKFKILNEMHYV